MFGRKNQRRTDNYPARKIIFKTWHCDNFLCGKKCSIRKKRKGNEISLSAFSYTPAFLFFLHLHFSPAAGVSHSAPYGRAADKKPKR